MNKKIRNWIIIGSIVGAAAIGTSLYLTREKPVEGPTRTEIVQSKVTEIKGLYASGDVENAKTQLEALVKQYPKISKDQGCDVLLEEYTRTDSNMKEFTSLEKKSDIPRLSYSFVEYKVKEGETFATISRDLLAAKLNVDPSTIPLSDKRIYKEIWCGLIYANPRDNPDILREGEVIKIYWDDIKDIK